MREQQSGKRPNKKPKATLLRAFFWLAAAGCVLATAAGLAGRTFWVFDLASHFRLQYAVFAIALAALFATTRSRSGTLLCLILAVVNLGWVLPIYLPDQTQFDESKSCTVKVVSVNVLTSNPHKAETINYLRESDADVLICLETDEAWAAELAALSDDYPYQLQETFRGNFGITLLSRIELANARIEWMGQSKVPAVVADVQCNNPFTLIGGHSVPPMKRQSAAARNDQLLDMARLAKTQPLPVALAGDFNITPYSPLFRDVLRAGELRDSRQGFGIHFTWPTFNPIFAIPIDHCLIQDGIRVKSRRTGKSFGSDHLPIVLELEIENRDRRENSTD